VRDVPLRAAVREFVAIAGAAGHSNPTVLNMTMFVAALNVAVTVLERHLPRWQPG